MICSNCGNAIDDQAAICVHCGAVTARGMYMGIGRRPVKPPVDPNEPANGGFIVLSLLIPLVGIILGAIESSNGKKRAGKAYIISAVASIVFWVVLSLLITFGSFLLSLLPYFIVLFASPQE